MDRPIGLGGMATVYRSHHIDDERQVAALKVLHDDDEDRDALATRMRRFERELRLLQRLDHPAIVRVLDAGTQPSPWIALQLVPGKPLDRVRPGRRPVDEVLALGSVLADALHHAHRLGVFHRDVKPSNILVAEDGQTWLVDFGIAMAVDESRITDPQRLAPGTLAYAPPEWFRAEDLDQPALADGYALGVVLWEQLTGALAFSTEKGRNHNITALLQQKARTRRLDPGDEVPEPVRDLVQGLTTADVRRRLSLAQARSRLRALHTPRAVPSEPPSKPLPAHGLPEPVGTFVGRRHERVDLAERLREGVRLITVTGPPGVGKSRLVLHVAADVAASFAGGVHAYDGRRMHQPADLDLWMGGLPRQRGPTLVVLDNMDRGLHAPIDGASRERSFADVVGRWIAQQPQMVVLATARQRLRADGERVLRLSPLFPSAAPGDA